MKKKRLIAFNILALILLITLCVILIFFENWLLPRTWVSLESLFNKGKSSFLFYIGEEYKPPLLTKSFIGIKGLPKVIPEIDFEAFWIEFQIYLKILFTSQNAVTWLLDVSEAMMNLTRIFMILMLIGIWLYIILQSYLNESGREWREDSKPKKLFIGFINGPWKKLIDFIKEFLIWFRKSPYFVITCITVACNLALPLVALDLVSEYFYFFTSFDFIALLDTLLADVITILAALEIIPLFIKIIVVYIIVRWYSFHRARKLIEGKLIPRDEKLVSQDTGVFTLILGKMRGGKTTLATAMARIMNTVYHKNAYDNMNRVSMMFPEFPWVALEKEIQRLASRRRLVNMNQCAIYVSKIYEKGKTIPRVLFGYDVSKQKTTFIDGANEIGLMEAMAIYAESYWVYFQKGNLIASNFPIRTDDIRKDKGHLIVYDSNYFDRKVKDMWSNSDLSHILVFDMLRFGKKKNENNPFKDTAGPMIGVATEFGKEEGNMISNQVFSAKDEEANPKNDLMDYSLKLGGHLANIWHTNFFKFIADEQRSGSLSSNLVNVAQTIYTADPQYQEEKMAVKLFWIEPLILEWLVNIRDKFYKDYRHNREDGTLLFEIVNRLGSWAYSILTKVYMRYGYKQVKLPSCTADANGNIVENDAKPFYIINFIDYASRFESACMKDFLNAKKPDAERGFFDLPTYKSLMPTKTEWDLQGSYLVSDLENPSAKFNLKPKASPRRNGSRRTAVADRSGTTRKGGDC